MQVTPVTIIPTELRFEMRQQIAVSQTLFSYALSKGHNIRALHKQTGARALLKGHAGPITDLRSAMQAKLWQAMFDNMLAFCTCDLHLHQAGRHEHTCLCNASIPHGITCAGHKCMTERYIFVDICTYLWLQVFIEDPRASYTAMLCWHEEFQDACSLILLVTYNHTRIWMYTTYPL